MKRFLPGNGFVKSYLFIFFLLFLAEKSFSQQGGITQIYTDYQGYWTSSSTAASATKPDNDHNLLGFSWNGATYSTGVNDAALTTKGVPFTPVVFQAFPVRNIPLTSPPSLIILGQLKDGVNNGASTPAPFTSPPQISNFLTDGVQGLNIGTGVIDVPASTPLIFDFGSIINVAKIGDGIPDLLVSQVGTPGGASDNIYFIDKSGNRVGNIITINHSQYSAVGTWSADLYDTNGALTANYTKTDRPLRVWAADVSVFGITSANYTAVTGLKYELNGSSDPAFLAFNTSVIQILSANDDAAATNIGATVAINVLNNDSPVNIIDPSSVTITTQPQHGTCTVSSTGVVSYTPTSGFYGTDSFVYIVYNSDKTKSDDAVVTVTVGGPLGTPVFDAGLISSRCSGTGSSAYTATASNSAGISYSLSPTLAGSIDASSGLLTWSATFSGTATITATASGQGGPKSADYTVTVNPIPPAPTVSGTTICSGNTATLTATAPGGTYNWYATASGGASLFTGASFATPNLTANTTYYVDVTSASGCTSARTAVTVTVNPIPPAPTVSGTTICSGNTATLTATAPGGTYNWYATASGGTSLSANASFATPNLTANTTYYVDVTSASGCTSARTAVTVTVNPIPPAPTVSGTTICSGNTATLTATAPGGTYNWYATASGGTSLSANASFATPNLTSTTTYYVDATSASGCTSARTTVAVTVNPIPPAPTVSGTTICSGNTATLTATAPGGTYNWYAIASGGTSLSANASFTTPNLTANTTYYVDATSASGCTSARTTVAVTVNPIPPAPTVSGTTICSGGTATLTATAPGGNYEWYAVASGGASLSTNASFTTPFLLSTTTYYVQTTVNGCTSSRTAVTVTVNAIPPAPTVADATICSGSTATLTATAPGGNYEWFDVASGGTSLSANTSFTTPNLTSTTTYYVDVTSASGCTSARTTVTVTVNPIPLAPTVSGTTICSGNTATLTATAPGGTYNWYATASGGTSLSANASFTTPNLTSTTTYYVDATSAAGCTSARTAVAVTVNPIPPAPTVSGTTICSGNQTTLTATGSTGTYNWYAAASGGASLFTGASFATPNLTSTTTYYVDATSASGCTSARTAIAVTVNPIPPAPTASGATICSGGTATLTATAPGGNYEWYAAASGGASLSTNASFTTPFLLSTTTYYVQTTVNGCTSSRTAVAVTVNPIPPAPTASGATICSGNTATLTATAPGGNYEWFDATSGGTSLSANASFTTPFLLSTTTYYVQTTVNGCTSARTAVTVTVNPIPPAPTVSGTTICSGNTATLTATAPGGTYNWYAAASGGASLFTGASFATPNLTSTTTYYVDATSAAGCTSSRTAVAVTVNPIPPAPTASGATICSGGTATLTATAPGGNYEWYAAASGGTSLSANASFTTPFLLSTTTYYVQTTVNGCTSARTAVTVTVNPTPALSNTSFNQVICSEGSSVPVTLTPDVSGTNFTWTATASASITRYTASGTDIIPAQTLVNAGLSAGTVTYTVKPFYNGCEGVNSTYTITVNPKPATPLVSSNSPVCNGASLMLTTPAVASAIYTWTGPNGFTSNLQNPEIANASAAAQGTYSLTITVNSCTGNAGTTTVTVNSTPPTPVAGSNGSICAGETLNLTAGNISGATYSWTGPNGFTSSIQNPATDNATVASSGTYAVTATINGCTGAAGTVTVVVNPIPPSPTLSSNSPVCAGSSLNLTATSIAGASYSWTGPNGFTSTLQNPVIPAATPVNSGTYTVAVSTTGCTSPASSITVLVDPPPAKPVLTSNSPVCSGNPIGITCTNYPGVTYQWTGPSGFTSDQQNPKINNAVTANQGRYTVVITKPGCSVANTAFIDIKVNEAPVAPVASNNSPVCVAQTLKLSATNVVGAIYNWTGPKGFTSNLQNPGISKVDAGNAGEYRVTVTVNSCTSGVASTTVIVNKPSVVTVGGDQNVCANHATVTVNGSIIGTSTTGIWSTSGSGSFTAGNTSLKGTYVPSAADISNGTVTLTLTATNTTPCAIASSSFKLTITPAPVVFAGMDQAICINDQAALNGKITNSDGGIWSSSGTGTFSPAKTSLNARYIPSERDKAEGSVVLTLTANGNCITVSDKMKILIVPPPKINAGADLFVMQGEKIVLQPAVIGTDLKYTWTPNLFLNDNTIKNPVSTGTDDITYTLTVTGTTGCVAQDQVFVKVLKPLKIPNTFTPNSDGINDTWNIKELDNYPGITVKIFNRYGAQLFFSQGYGVPWDGTYNGRQLPVGTYYYIIDLKTYGKLLSGPVTIIR